MVNVHANITGGVSAARGDADPRTASGSFVLVKGISSLEEDTSVFAKQDETPSMVVPLKPVFLHSDAITTGHA